MHAATGTASNFYQASDTARKRSILSLRVPLNERKVGTYYSIRLPDVEKSRVTAGRWLASLEIGINHRRAFPYEGRRREAFSQQRDSINCQRSRKPRANVHREARYQSYRVRRASPPFFFFPPR